MADMPNFRIVLRGFHCDDVVHYIDYLNSKHAIEINQLNTQLEQLRNQTETPSDILELLEQLAAAQETNDQLQAQIAELEERCNLMGQQTSQITCGVTNPHLENRCRELERQLEEVRATPAAPQYHASQELELYRRAERTEREARERAELVYRQTHGALADATVKVDEAFGQIGDMADKVNEQLMQLQQAVTVSRQALADAAASLYHVNPGLDK